MIEHRSIFGGHSLLPTCRIAWFRSTAQMSYLNALFHRLYLIYSGWSRTTFFCPKVFLTDLKWDFDSQNLHCSWHIRIFTANAFEHVKCSGHPSHWNDHSLLGPVIVRYVALTQWFNRVSMILYLVLATFSFISLNACLFLSITSVCNFFVSH